MTRALGAALLIAASVSVGFYAGARAEKRCEALEECLALINTFSSSICYSDESLPSIIHSACESGRFKQLSFLDKLDKSDWSEGFAVVWKRCVEAESKAVLDSENRAALIGFGSRLGKTDKKDQLELCAYFKKQFETLCTQARGDVAEQVKLRRVAGCAAGGLIFILLSGG